MREMRGAMAHRDFRRHSKTCQLLHLKGKRIDIRLLGRLLGYSRPQAAGRAEQLLHAFGLTEAENRLVKKYSGGMRRRLDIAASIVVTPELMFLDEPTTGLDPRSRNQVWDIVRALVAQGTTVLLCTQYLDEAEQLADQIAILHDGRVIADGTLAELRQLLPPATVELVEKQPTLEDIFLAIVGQAGSAKQEA